MIDRVAHVLWGGRVGGIQRIVHNLALEQAKLGIKPTIFLGNEGGEFVDRWERAGIEVRSLGFKSGHDVDPRILRAAAAELKSFDLVHLHNFNLPLTALAFMLRPHPVVYTEHIPLEQVRPSRRFARKFFLRRTGLDIVAVSDHTAGLLSDYFDVPRGDIEVIRNGIPLPRTHTTREERDGTVRVAFVGNLVGWKRVHLILDALAHCTSDRVEGWIVGIGPAEEDLKARAAELGIEDKVRFLGYRDDTEEVMRRVDVLVQPSSGDPCPLAVLEASGYGLLPAAFADGGGTLELLPPDGVVVDGPEQLARFLDELVDDDRVSDAARAERAGWLARMYPIVKTHHAYLQVYENAIDKSPRAA